MNYFNFQIVILFIGLSLSVGGITVASARSASSEADSLRYIDDHLVVRIRDGRSEKDKIVKTVSSGTELELLEQKGKYSKVRTKKGRTGWILSVYLRKNPIAKVRLKQAQQTIQQANSQIEAKEKEFKDLNERFEQLQKQHETTQQNLETLQQENKQLLELASDPMKLTKENNQLSQQTASLQQNLSNLKTQMQQLRDDSTKQWFLNGAGVILFGILIGLQLPKLRRQRRSDWSSY